MFQSLFQWTLLTNTKQIIILQISIICFNPCFSGSCSRIGTNLLRETGCTLVSILVLVDLAHEFFLRTASFGQLLFQSLFQWILLTNSKPPLGTTNSSTFQSLFQWILLTNEKFSMQKNQDLGFNPCFSGSCSRIIRTVCRASQCL